MSATSTSTHNHTNIDIAHKYKNDKYALLLKDIEGIEVSLIPFKIGSRGYLTPKNIKRV